MTATSAISSESVISSPARGPRSTTTSAYRSTRVFRNLPSAGPYWDTHSTRGWSVSSLYLTQRSALPCRSPFTRRTGPFECALMPARLVATTVLPTPPFSATTAIIMFPLAARLTVQFLINQIILLQNHIPCMHRPIVPAKKEHLNLFPGLFQLNSSSQSSIHDGASATSYSVYLINQILL